MVEEEGFEEGERQREGNPGWGGENDMCRGLEAWIGVCRTAAWLA